MEDFNQTRWWWWENDREDSGGSRTWVLSILASCAVGLSGIVPLVVVPDVHSKGGDGGRVLKLLLSFAVGGLLGDVFLHLLPEAWNVQKEPSWRSHLMLGVWVLSGLFTFVVVEMMFTFSKEEEPSCNSKQAPLDANQNVSDEFWDKELPLSEQTSDIAAKDDRKNSAKHITGYLNLVANAVDNFSHGLAVAASFIVGTKMGLLTTAAILIHEIPHEVGDFAILLRSGFNRWEAAKAQLSTATIGVAGAIFALSANSLEDVGESTSWILPFTAGGFINIALVNILPDLMKEADPWESLKQVVAICLGIGVMASVSVMTT